MSYSISTHGEHIMEATNPHEINSVIDYSRRLYTSHYRGAWLRISVSLFMWLFAFAAYLLDLIRINNLAGISAAVAFLVLMNPPALWTLKRLKSRRLSDFFSLFMNLLEILGYTAVIYFLGGVRALWLSPMYAVLIGYIGTLGPPRLPFLVAGFCGAEMALMVGLEYLGIIPNQDPIYNVKMPGVYQVAVVVTIASYLYVVALVSAYTGKLLRRGKTKLREKNVQIQESNESLMHAQQELDKAYQILEQRVEERTAELKERSEGLKSEIEERERTQEALRESEERFELALRGADLGMWDWNIETGYVIFNERWAEMLGYSLDEIEPHVRSWEKLIHPDDTPRVMEVLKDNLEGKTALYETEFRLRTKEGDWNWILARAMVFERDETGKPLRSVGTHLDITERRRAEETLRKAHDMLEIRVEERTAELLIAKEKAEVANQSKSAFLANMSHELRTPLNHIIGFTELVVDKHFGDLTETQDEYLNDALQSSKHLLSLINDILDLSKVEAGKLELKLSDLNLKALLENSLIMVKEKAMKHRIQLSTHMTSLPEIITVDERKLKQILYNLLSNAVKFTPDGGRVCLSASSVDISSLPGGIGPAFTRGSRKVVQFSVTDTGIGLKQEDIERIFNPFDQVEHSASRRYHGTGLGLALTKTLVELHGGRIWVESEGEGKGSVFRFVILT